MPPRSIAARSCSPKPARAAIPAACPPPSWAWKGRVPRTATARTTCRAGTSTGAWTKTDDFKKRMREIVQSPDFLKDNYLSSEFRVPVTLLQTNACSPLARNALADNIWDNFSSQSYKDLPSVGSIKVKDPITGADRRVRHAGRWTRLYQAAFPDQPVVDCAVSLEQHGRRLLVRSLDRRPHEDVPGRHRADAVAGEARARSRSWATRALGSSTARPRRAG